MKSAIQKIFLVVSLSLIVSYADVRAGDEKGNGNRADVLVCNQNTNTETVELLDFHEAYIRYGLTFDKTNNQKSWLAQALIAVEKLKNLDPERYNLYKYGVSNFEKESRLVPGIVLNDAPDSEYIYTPNNCVIQQIVRQGQVQFPGERRYIVSKDLWDKLDENNKAGVVLHEVIYREMISQGHNTSTFTRYFNSVLFSTFGNAMTQEQYFEIIRSGKIDEKKLFPYLIKYNNGSFYAEGTAYKFPQSPLRVIGSALIKFSDNSTVNCASRCTVWLDSYYRLQNVEFTSGTTILLNGIEFVSSSIGAIGYEGLGPNKGSLKFLWSSKMKIKRNGHRLELNVIDLTHGLSGKIESNNSFSQKTLNCIQKIFVCAKNVACTYVEQKEFHTFTGLYMVKSTKENYSDPLLVSEGVCLFNSETNKYEKAKAVWDNVSVEHRYKYQVAFQLTMDEKHNVRKISTQEGIRQFMTLRLAKNRVIKLSMRYIDFHENGYPSMGFVYGNGQVAYMDDGTKVELKDGAKVFFDTKGYFYIWW